MQSLAGPSCLSVVGEQVSGVLDPNLESLQAPRRNKSVPLPEVGWKLCLCSSQPAL